MAADPHELLTRWTAAETHYRDVVDRLVTEATEHADIAPTKQHVLEVEQARAAADQRRDKYFRRVLTRRPAAVETRG